MKAAAGALLAVAAQAAEGPCDIYGADGAPCVAAHSTVRALYGSYNGKLYQVKRASDSATTDIPTLSPGGFANSAIQDTFCQGTSCTINAIYDQSPQQNHLALGVPGGACHRPDTGTDATAERLLVGGHPVYSAKFEAGNGYRNDTTSGVAVNDEAETIYMVTSGRHYNGACCFDYGNAETDDNDDGAGTMEAVYFGNAKGGLNHGGAGKGPWIMADMEDALWGADVVKSNEPLIQHDYVTAMIKGDETKLPPPGPPGPYQEDVDFVGSDIAPCGDNGCVLPSGSTHSNCRDKCTSAKDCVGYVFADESCSGQSGPICWTKGAMSGTGTKKSCRNSQNLFPEKPKAESGHWAIKGGNAQTGGLRVYWDGKRAPGYAPMKKQGAIILGIGGDNSCGAVGTFYEGVMTKGYTSDAADDKVQANIVAAGYKDMSVGSVVV